ncbi:hypothetical protein KY366_04030 [Candidatus Woesearchaeota archaeon]|nr:hypothetical protein [Candidatus Woesearchaeota archaeon]
MNYVMDFLKAKSLAEKGDPAFEIFLDRANWSYIKANNCNSSLYIKKSEDPTTPIGRVHHRIISPFKEKYAKPIDTIEGLTQDIEGLGEQPVTPIWKAKKEETGESWSEYSIFGILSGIDPKEQNLSRPLPGLIEVKYDPENEITTLERKTTLSGITYAKVTIKDPGSEIFETLNINLSMDNSLQRLKEILNNKNQKPTTQYN